MDDDPNESGACLVSFFAQVDDDFRSREAKQAYLWFDRVFLDEIGSQSFEHRVGNILQHAELSVSAYDDIRDVFRPLKEAIGAENVKAVRAMKLERSGYPRWGTDHVRYDYPDPATPYEAAHNAVLRHLESEVNGGELFAGYDVEQAEGSAKVAADSVELWNFVKQFQDCSLHCDRREKVALGAAASFLIPGGAVGGSKTLFEIVFPDLETLPWRDVVRLRRSGALKRLRSVVATADGDVEFARRSLEAFEDAELEELFEGARPRVLRTSVEAILSNTPIQLLLSPLSVGLGMKAVASEFGRQRRYGWIYLLREARRMASGSPPL